MRKLFKSKPFIIMIVAVVLLGVLVFASSAERNATWVESTVGAVFQPVQTFAAKVSDGIINTFKRIFKTTDADKELEQANLRLAQLEAVQSENENLKAENERLKSLLNFAQQNIDYSYVTASVIGNNQGVWFDVFTINAGRNKGIEKDMAVVNSSGLVGRVSEVGATYSKVVSIIDAENEVSVMVERTRDFGMTKGLFSTSKDNLLSLYFLPSGFDLVPGDVVVTSGMGGIYPKGLVVGTVSEVIRNADEQSSNAIIEASVDFGHIEEVMVITGSLVEDEAE